VSETHESRMPCPTCLGTDAVIIRNGPHAGVHCAVDDTWLYWAPKVELGEEPEPRSRQREWLYKGYWFRSLAEARWASFFDHVGWKWTVEPFNTGGYVPDFLILGRRPMVVEVKGKAASIEELSELTEYVYPKLLGEWDKDILCLGSKPLRIDDKYVGDSQIGILSEWYGDDGWGNGEAIFCHCPSWTDCGCTRYGIGHSSGSYSLRPNSCYDGNLNLVEESQIEELWALATNATRWIPSRKAETR
jgi:hypothetical protein